MRHLHQHVFWEGYFSPSFSNWTGSLNQSSAYGEKELQTKIHLLLRYLQTCVQTVPQEILSKGYAGSQHYLLRLGKSAGTVSDCHLCFITYIPFPLHLLNRNVTHTELAATLTFLKLL